MFLVKFLSELFVIAKSNPELKKSELSSYYGDRAMRRRAARAYRRDPVLDDPILDDPYPALLTEKADKSDD